MTSGEVLEGSRTDFPDGSVPTVMRTGHFPQFLRPATAPPDYNLLSDGFSLPPSSALSSGCNSKGKCIVPSNDGHCIGQGGRCGCGGRPVDIFCGVGSRTEFTSAPVNAVGPCPRPCTEQSACGPGLVCRNGFCAKP